MNETNTIKIDNTVTLKIGDLPFMARESFNMLRGNIQMSGANVKTIAVTSAIIHEGKSSVAVRLAYSMAALEKKTVFIDCDIRNSNFKSRYVIGKSKSAGLTGYLCGLSNVQNAITHTQFENFDLIMTGRISPNPSELISSELFREMLDELKENYDYIILDTPPINAVVDGAIIAKQCDGTVLVLESTRSERKQAIRAMQQLQYAGAHILGCVLNKADNSDRKYGYGYSKKYGFIQKYGYGNYDDYGTYFDNSEKLHKGKSKEDKRRKRKKILSWTAYLIVLIIVIAGIGYLLMQNRKMSTEINNKINNLINSEGTITSSTNVQESESESQTENAIVVDDNDELITTAETATTINETATSETETAEKTVTEVKTDK